MRRTRREITFFFLRFFAAADLELFAREERVVL
jgi:hypothetical protein